MTWIIIGIVLLVIALLFVRSKIANINESTGRNICPRCTLRWRWGQWQDSIAPNVVIKRVQDILITKIQSYGTFGKIDKAKNNRRDY